LHEYLDEIEIETADVLKVRLSFRESTISMASKSLNRVFRCKDCSLRTGAPYFAFQSRSFTSSNPRRKHGKRVLNSRRLWEYTDSIGAVPTFTEVSTPELQDLLSTMRQNVFLPAHLSKPHQALVFGARHRKLLEDDPVTVEVAGENFQLKHIDRMKDQPGSIDSLLKAVSLMKEKKDWDNLPILLEGLRIAGRKLKPQYWEKLVRKAGQAGQQSTILECVRRASRTGFVLKDLNLVREIMWWIQYKALSTGWTAQSTRKGLAMAEQIVDLLEDEKHCGGTFLCNSDPRARPEVAGILLQLAASHSKLTGGKDEDRKVEIYSKRLLGTLARKANLREGLPDGRELWTSNALLCNITPIVYAMRVAAEILSPNSEISKQLKEQEPALAAIATREREKIMAKEPAEESSKRTGVWNYNLLLGPQEA
jgi:hypothetical protein